ncbi:MAG: substrate-binding domain-containing protein [Acidobacteriales bacterium]|nr:substrate-binding domain-containing protein [Terriglobales bacterium]
MKSQTVPTGAVARACGILKTFRQPEEVLELREIAHRCGMNKSTVCRILSTLTANSFVERVGRHGYRSCIRQLRSKHFRVGYAAQSTVVSFITTVTDSLTVAAQAAALDLLVVNNRASRKIALANADHLVRERVDLAIEFQLYSDIAEELAAKFSAANIPLIALDTPHPNAIYFGADNYKAGRMAGMQLARWAAKHWHGQVDEILLVGATSGGPALEARMLGVADGIAEALPHTHGKPKTTLDTKTAQVDLAFELVRKHLRSSRATHTLVGTVNDPTALAVLQVFREHGAETKSAIVGQGATAEARHEMRRPGTSLIGSVAYFPETYGERLVPLVLDMLCHRPVPRSVLTRHVMVTPANVNKVYPNDLLLGPSIQA